MNIQAIKSNFSTNYGVKSCTRKTLNNISNSNMSDSFVKQSSDISFTGFRKKKPAETKVEKNITDSLKNVSVKGMPFFIGFSCFCCNG